MALEFGRSEFPPSLEVVNASLGLISFDVGRLAVTEGREPPDLGGGDPAELIPSSDKGGSGALALSA